VRTGAVVASPSPVSEVGSVSSPSAPVEVQATDVTAVSNVQAAVTSSTAATSNAATRVDVVREPAVPMEIQDAVSAIQEATSGDSHIRVRLNPRELGNMLVDVSRTENGIVARLEVESAAARVAILETLPDLQQSLSRSGSTVDRVEVVLTETRAESGRQESDQSQPREQQSRQERQSSNQQARDDQNQRREQNQRRNQREDGSSVVEDATGNETSEQLDIKL
jgi:flagellar hook-length control protein FliK